MGTTNWPAGRKPASTVHPHACGDYLHQAELEGGEVGPSPRVWGLPAHPGGGPGRCRSIPTRVGTTAPRSPPRGAGPVHPHACGDYAPLLHLDHLVVGPSPRVWGLRKGSSFGGGPGRSIPTRVGTTGSCAKTRAGPSVHPHACGDYALANLQPARHVRSIPTRVGTTGGRPSTGARRTVHPHACGDYVLGTLQAVRSAGPSPRVWGLPVQRGAQARPARSIPTRVGTTLWGPRGWRRSRSIPTRVGTTAGVNTEKAREAVHPHACGDYLTKTGPPKIQIGPSPRVWGLQVGRGRPSRHRGPSPRVWGLLPEDPQGAVRVRSIPTRVGTTDRIRPRILGHTVHPHACGDYPEPDGAYGTIAGPSPRVWGLRIPCLLC